MKEFKCKVCGSEESFKITSKSGNESDAILSIKSIDLDLLTVFRACKECGAMFILNESFFDSDYVLEADKKRARAILADIEKQKEEEAKKEGEKAVTDAEFKEDAEEKEKVCESEIEEEKKDEEVKE